MKKSPIFTAIALVLVSMSCIQMRIDQSIQQCPLHHIALKKAIVNIEYGRGCSDINTEEYPFAKKDLCTDIVRSIKYKKGRMLYCTKCTKIKES